MPKAETSEAPGVTIRGAGAEQKLFGRYTLKRVLGRGGMGIVWLAHDDELKRSVAMKFLPDMIVRDREAVEDLKRETRRSLDLTHHHIVRIYDFTQDENSAAIIMEYVDGETLSAMKTQQPGSCFSVSTLSIWAGHFCQALDYAHRQARVVHRDLKPANLMVNSRGDLKITDFGISRSMSDSMTRVSMSNTAGTLAYMSPEQALGAPPAVSDDIYAFGATMYDLLTGRPPFFRGNLQVQLETVVPPPMHARRAELGNSGEPIPALWEEVIAASLAKKPGDRPQSMAEIANLLGIGGPTTGYRPGTSPTFAPLAGVIVPGTTRATQAAQPPTAPTLQRTLTPEELVTQVQGGPAPPASLKVPTQTPGTNQPIKPTSMGDVVPGFDLAPEPRAKSMPAPAPSVPETNAKPEPETSEFAAPAPEAEAEVEVGADQTPPPVGPTVLEAVDDSFPTMVGEPLGRLTEVDVTPAEVSPVVEEVPSVVAEEPSPELPPANDVELAPATDEPPKDSFPTLPGVPIKQDVESPPDEVEQTPLLEQESESAAEDLHETVTLSNSAISLPSEELQEIEFPTFPGTPLAEAETPQAVAEPPPIPPSIETAPPAEPVAFAPHTFTPAASPTLPQVVPPRKPLGLVFTVLAIALVVIGGAVWMGMQPHKGPQPTPREKLAQPYIEQGRTYFTAGALDDAANQARLALERNPGDPRAIQLQSEIEAKRKVLAAERAAADKAAAEKEAAAKKAADDKAIADAAEREAAEKRAMEAATAAAQKLVQEGEDLYPNNLAAARQKAQDALAKVPEYPSAVTLMAKVEARQQKESQWAAKLREASGALDRDDLDAAEQALDDLPPEISTREDVLKLRESIAKRRGATKRREQPTPRPQRKPPTEEPQRKKPIKEVTPKTSQRDDRDDRGPRVPPPSKPDPVPAPTGSRSRPMPTPRAPGLPHGSQPPGG